MQALNELPVAGAQIRCISFESSDSPFQMHAPPTAYTKQPRKERQRPSRGQSRSKSMQALNELPVAGAQI